MYPRVPFVAHLVSRSVLTLFLVGVFALAQAVAASQGRSPSKPAASSSKSAASQPASSSKDAPTSKGFSRMAVTPEVKQQFEGEQNRYAVVVAPNYAGSELNPLRFTVADTLELKTELERQGYVVRLISPGEATADAIRSALSAARQLLEGKEQTTFLFAFSGHGFQLKDTAGKDRNYLVTLGVTRERLAEDALALDDVEKIMADSGARRKVVLIDACRNDPNAKSTDGPRTFTQLQESEGTAILLSTRPGGFSYEDQELGHGIFTYYLLDGLRGKAAGKDGFVTFYDLEKYVESSVVARATKKDLVQRPFAMGEHFGDFLLATAAPPKPGDIVALPAAAQQVDSNSSILWQMAANGRVAQSFYGLANGAKLTLVNNKTLAPYTELEDSGLNDLDPGYRHFKGTANNQVFDIAVQMKGDAVVSAKGRVGTPCPNVCTTPNQLQTLLLPGEKLKAEPVRSGADKAKRGAGAMGQGLSILTHGRSAKSTNTGAVAADTTVKGVDSQNDLLRFRWEPFDLTSSVPKQAAH